MHLIVDSALPNTPTVNELGFKGIETEGWNGLLAPAKVPTNVVTRIQQAVAIAIQETAVKQGFVELGAEGSGSTPQQMADLLEKQFRQFRPMVENLKLD